MASGYSDLSEIRKDGGFYGVSQKPPKINLINELPRRESVVERQLATKLAHTNIGQSTQQVEQQVHFNLGHDYGQRSQASSSLCQNDGFNNSATDFASCQQSSGFSQAATSTTPRPVHSQPQQRPNSMGPQDSLRAYSELVNDLALKEAKLRREMAYLNQQMSPWARPRQIRAPRQEPELRTARSQQRWVKECPSPSRSLSRPTSRASSTRSNTEADLMEKTAKLLKDAVEIEKKPLKTQEVLIENGARRRETSQSPSAEAVSSIHTAIIKVPNQEIDNKSPLPFAYDNFSTLGVRGNIASVGAAPPETPYPPIFPIVKRTPSPANHRR